MAIVKHSANKNMNYSGAVEYLTMKYDEHLNKPILDDHGQLQMRDSYRISYTTPDGEKADVEQWEVDCNRTNMKYGKGQGKDEIRTHMYIVAFDPQDNLTIDEVQANGEEIAREYFAGHGYLVAAHDNHVHIVINATRDADMEKRSYMKHRCEYAAGSKHNCSASFLRDFKEYVMQFCRERGLNQVDLLKPAAVSKSDKEYLTEKKLHEQGKISQKEYCRWVIDYAKSTAKSVEEYVATLKEYNVEMARRGSNIRYKTVSGEKWIRDKRLGADYQIDAIYKQIDHNKQMTEPKLQNTSSLDEKILLVQGDIQDKIDSMRSDFDLPRRQNHQVRRDDWER